MPVKAKRVKTKRDIARAVDLSARVFSTYFQGVQQWTDLLRLDPGYSPGQNFVVELGGELIANIRVSLRHGRLGRGVGLMGGIGDVGTNMAYRHQGYASVCLVEAIRFMEEAGCCLSFLGAGPLPFYRRQGWEVAVRGYRVQVAMSGPPPEALDGYSRRAFDLDEDLPAVMELYSSYNAGRSLSVVRDEDYWRRQWEFSTAPPPNGPCAFLKEDPEAFLLIHDSKRSVVAYARGRYSRDRVEVVEAAARDRRSALALLAHLAEHYRARHEIVMEEPPDSLIADVALTECGGTWTLSRTGHMIRVVDMQRLFQAMAPEFSARLRGSELAGASGSLRVQTEVGAATIEWDRGEMSATRARKAPLVRLPGGRLAQMVCGYLSPSSVLEVLGQSGDLASDQLRALEILFPRAFPHMHVLDRS